MKRQYSDDSSDSSSSSSNEQEVIPTKFPSSNNNRSRRYVDNIVQTQPTITIQQQQQPTSSTLRNIKNSSTNQTPLQNTLSYPFVSSTTKVPTNRRHLKLRKQLKTCSNFSSSYFVLDMNAPATSTIGFMGSIRGNDIPVLLNETVSSNNNNFQSNSQTAPRKKIKKNEKNITLKTKKKKNGNYVASVNTTVSCSPNTNLNTNFSLQQPSSVLQQLNNSVNRSNSNHLICNTPQPTDQLVQNFQLQPIPQSNHVQSINSFHNSTINFQNYRNLLQSNQNNNMENMISCFGSPLLGLSLDTGSVTTPSTPSTNSGVASPNVGSGSMMHGNIQNQVNPMINGNSYGMATQNTTNGSGYINNNLNTNYNPITTQSMENLTEVLSHEDARTLFNTKSLYNKLQNLLICLFE